MEPPRADEKRAVPPPADPTTTWPLPAGFVQRFDHNTQHPYWVDTTVNPPVSYWTHPAVCPEYLASVGVGETSGPSLGSRISGALSGQPRQPAEVDTLERWLDNRKWSTGKLRNKKAVQREMERAEMIRYALANVDQARDHANWLNGYQQAYSEQMREFFARNPPPPPQKRSFWRGRGGDGSGGSGSGGGGDGGCGGDGGGGGGGGGGE